MPQAAETLGVSVSTVWRWIRAGRLHAYRFGPKAIRLRTEDVRAAENAVERAPGRVSDSAFRVFSDRESAMRPMTPDERRRAWAALAAADAFREALSARRGGALLPDSTPIIRAARAERSRRR